MLETLRTILWQALYRRYSKCYQFRIGAETGAALTSIPATYFGLSFGVLNGSLAFGAVVGVTLLLIGTMGGGVSWLILNH